METILTQRELIAISRRTGMSFDFRMKKSQIMMWVEAGLCKDGKNFPDVKKAEEFASEVVRMDKLARREKKLKSLGL